jgi:hypothetical protein
VNPQRSLERDPPSNPTPSGTKIFIFQQQIEENHEKRRHKQQSKHGVPQPFTSMLRTISHQQQLPSAHDVAATSFSSVETSSGNLAGFDGMFQVFAVFVPTADHWVIFADRLVELRRTSQQPGTGMHSAFTRYDYTHTLPLRQEGALTDANCMAICTQSVAKHMSASMIRARKWNRGL